LCCNHPGLICFKTLQKIFSYDKLTPELKKYKKQFFKYFRSKIKAHAEELRKNGDMDSYRRLHNLLKQKENI